MKMSKIKRKTILYTAVILGVGGAFISPAFLIIMNSFKPNREIMLNFLAFPKELYFENFIRAAGLMSFFRAFFNTSLITLGSVTLALVVTFLAAYGISHLQGKFADFLYLFFVAGMLVPFHAVMVYIAIMASVLHMSNTYWGMILLNSGFYTSFGIMTYTGFLKSVPRELEEAATIDGCSVVQMMLKVVFPLLKPTSMTLLVLYFLWSWNDYLLPSILLGGDERRTLTVQLYMFKGATNTEWDLLIAGLTLSILPIILVYVLAQKYITNGMLAGAVKA